MDIELTIIEADNLVNKDIGGKSDPYVVIRWEEQKIKTRVIKNSLQPRWDALFRIRINNPSQPIDLRVMDKDKFVDDSLGRTFISVASLAQGQTREAWIKLDQVETGRIKVRIARVDKAGKGGKKKKHHHAHTPVSSGTGTTIIPSGAPMAQPSAPPANYTPAPQPNVQYGAQPVQPMQQQPVQYGNQVQMQGQPMQGQPMQPMQPVQPMQQQPVQYGQVPMQGQPMQQQPVQYGGQVQMQGQPMQGQPTQPMQPQPVQAVQPAGISSWFQGNASNITRDPHGHVLYGKPIQPAPAYVGQIMPAPYVYRPPTVFYQPPQAIRGLQSQPTIPPPQFFYGMPANYQQPAYAPPAVQVVPVVPGVSYQEDFSVNESNCNSPYAPSPEVVADFSDGDYTTTNVNYNGDCTSVTHLNLFYNDVRAIKGLSKFPNLMRLTVRANDLQSLVGINEAPYLRWIDASSNDLTTLSGLSNAPSLEWLNVQNNDIKDFGGFAFAPNLTWLNCHHNDIRSLQGCEAFRSLAFIDLSSNDLKTVRGLEQCLMLQEINVANNDLSDMSSVLQLAQLPHLFCLNIYLNKFSATQQNQIVTYFKGVKPNCVVVNSAAESKARGHNVKYRKK